MVPMDVDGGNMEEKSSDEFSSSEIALDEAMKVRRDVARQLLPEFDEGLQVRSRLVVFVFEGYHFNLPTLIYLFSLIIGWRRRRLWLRSTKMLRSRMRARWRLAKFVAQPLQMPIGTTVAVFDLSTCVKCISYAEIWAVGCCSEVVLRPLGLGGRHAPSGCRVCGSTRIGDVSKVLSQQICRTLR